VVTKLLSQIGYRIVWLVKTTSTLGQELLHEGSHAFGTKMSCARRNLIQAKAQLHQPKRRHSSLAPPRLRPIDCTFSARRQFRQQRLRTLAIGRRRNLRRLSITLRHALVLLAHLLRHAARVADGRGIAIVGVNAHKVGRHAIDFDVADHDIAWASITGAIATAAVYFADSDERCVFDRHGAAPVVLDDFVFGCVGSAALPEDVAGAESRNGICREIVSKAFPRCFMFQKTTRPHKHP
jgi:hypothetical protein